MNLACLISLKLIVSLEPSSCSCLFQKALSITRDVWNNIFVSPSHFEEYFQFSGFLWNIDLDCSTFFLTRLEQSFYLLETCGLISFFCSEYLSWWLRTEGWWCRAGMGE